MKIRHKLILIYGALFVTVLIAGAVSIQAVLGWSDSAEKLAELHSRSLQAERLRANTYRQAGYAADYLLGENRAKIYFQEVQEQSNTILDELASNVSSEVEKDHIESLRETQDELVWIVNKFFDRDFKTDIADALPSSLERLNEISDEVEDEVLGLNMYYRSIENKGIEKATEAGKFVTIIIIMTIVLALIQFGLLVFLLQRWLVRPILVMNEATNAIASGNLDISVNISGEDEWGQLSDTVNKMVLSLKDAQQRLREQERLAALGEIAAYTAHNIRNPLAGIRAAGQVIKGSRVSNDAETTETINEIIATIDRLDAWLKGLMEFARPLDLNINRVDINQLVKEAVPFAHNQFEKDSVEVNWNLTDHMPEIKGDAILLEQVIFAVATNAFQAIGESGQINVFTTMTNDDGSDWATVQIIDNGPGLPDNIKAKLFKVFVSSKEGGTGMGLAHAKKIIDAHRGKISIDSEIGGGTRVSICLPVDDSKPDGDGVTKS